MSDLPPLKPLHPETSLIRSKLALFEKWSTEKLKQSLTPGQEHCLKTRPDGIVLDGHHRIYILKLRGERVDSLAREIIAREPEFPIAGE